MYRLTILYGPPDDPTAFDRHYRDVHIPLAATMPGFTGWTLTPMEPGPDAAAPAYHLAVELYAESRAALEAALATPEAQAASADVATFASGGVTYLWGEAREVPFG